MPRNSPTGFVCAFFATVMGFALIWHIWWMAILGLLGAFATFVVFAWRDDGEYEIPAERSRGSIAKSRGVAALPAMKRGGMSRRRDRRSDHVGRWPRARRSPATARAARPEAHRRRLRLLDLPAERHHHVLGVLRHLCGAARRHRGRTGRHDLFDPHNVAIETGCLLISSFACGIATLAARRATSCVPDRAWR